MINPAHHVTSPHVTTLHFTTQEKPKCTEQSLPSKEWRPIHNPDSTGRISSLVNHRKLTTCVLGERNATTTRMATSSFLRWLSSKEWTLLQSALPFPTRITRKLISPSI